MTVPKVVRKYGELRAVRARPSQGNKRLRPSANSPYRDSPHKTRVVGDFGRAALVATQDVTPQRRAAALFDGRHDLELTQAQVSTLAQAPGGTVDAEDVGDLQGGARHSPMGASGSPGD